MKIYLIDGTFELFRAYFSSPSSKNSHGQEVGAVKGLIRNLKPLLTKQAPVACAFDTVIESFRNRLYDGYKTGDGIEPALFSQFPIAEQACRELGMVVWSMIEHEADDALATAANRFAALKSVSQVILCSPDKDLAQCVTSNRVVTWDRIRNKIYDEAAVIEKFGVSPKSIPDWLGLIGDSADGIPGLAGWGTKAATAALATYQHIENIPKDCSQWTFAVRGAQKLSTTLNENYKDALLYKKLATLVTDVPLNESLDDLCWKEPMASCEQFIKSLG